MGSYTSSPGKLSTVSMSEVNPIVLTEGTTNDGCRSVHLGLLEERRDKRKTRINRTN